MIRDALSSLPARPVLYLVPAVIVMVLSLYYWDLHARCARIEAQRGALTEWVRSADSSLPLRLESFTEFAWDQVRIAVGYKPQRGNGDCPLGWNWPRGEREALIANGRLTLLVFARAGEIVEYLELRGDQIDFRGIESVLTPQTAVFELKPAPAGDAIELWLNP